MAAGMCRVCGNTVTVETDGQENLVDGIGTRMCGFRKHTCGLGSESCNQFRNRDDEVGKERDHDGASALAFCDSPQSGGRASLGQVPQSRLGSFSLDSIRLARGGVLPS